TIHQLCAQRFRSVGQAAAISGANNAALAVADHDASADLLDAAAPRVLQILQLPLSILENLVLLDPPLSPSPPAQATATA
ncbi:hypothetical protein Dimus_020237, partial [Dionaea muscipula]